jgi:hypothetical protein
MSFFDDASLAFLPSGAAGKDGKAYSIKPVPEYGAELITNGDFATDTGWNKGAGWSISSGTANCNGTTTTLVSNIPITPSIGKTGKLRFEITNYVSGKIALSLNGTGGSDTGTLTPENGFYEFDLFGVMQANSTFITIYSTAFIGSIDNVSVKEVLVGDGDFTFSRGSNLSATRVGADGLIEKGRENLLLQSNQFDTTWGGNASNRSITSGFSGYDGSNDAWKLEAISDNNYSVVSQLVSSAGVETFSVYAKAGTSNFFRIQITGGVNTSASYFDLSGGGSVGANFNNIDAKIESVGNGWFRCSVTGNKTTSSSCVIYVIDAEGSTNVTTGANIYIQSAQLEIGLAATDYIESGASTGKAGLLEDEPRFDYSGGATCPSLLLEPSRTQLIGNSELINPTIDTTWKQVGSNTFTNNYGISPDGSKNSTLIEFGGTTSSYQAYYQAAVTAGAHTISIYAKGSGSFKLGIYDNASILTDTITLTSDWQRFEVTKTTAATSAARCVWLYPNGDGDTIEVWGVQTEAGSYPTSYIPNHSGGTITRLRDQANNSSLNPILGNGNISVMYDFVYDVVGREGSGQLFLLYSDNNSLGIKGTQPADRRLQLFSYGDFSGTIGFNEDVPYQTRHKVVVRVTGEVVELFYNGVKQNATISGAALGGVYNWSRIKIDPTNAFLAGLNQLVVFPEALSDADCITLTTI